MVIRSTVFTKVPSEVRKELEKRLVEKGFSGYDELSSWLQGLGFGISMSAVGRFARRFERRVSAITAATERARAVAEAASGDDGTTTEALIRLVQERLFNVLIETEKPLKQLDLARLARTVGDLSRTTITHRRWVAESQDRLEHQRRAATGKLDSIEGEGGLSPAAVQLMRDLLMSMDPFAPPPPPPAIDR